MEVLTELRTAQVPREYYEELTETVRVGLREQRARERAERAEAARKAREDRDKKRQEERGGRQGQKEIILPFSGENAPEEYGGNGVYGRDGLSMC
ncbi:MAG: hypothetical protein ACLT38_09925 [Akkermansia sp.]